MAAYRNPWHRSGAAHFGPPEFVTEANPTEYRGHLIYQRVPGAVWDVVKDGVCVTQRAGMRGARDAVDAIVARKRCAA